MFPYKPTGKSPHKFSYTYKDVSRLTGLSVETLRVYSSQGKFKVGDLGSVVNFVIKRRSGGTEEVL